MNTPVPEVGETVRWITAEEDPANKNFIETLRRDFPGILKVESYADTRQDCPDKSLITISHDGEPIRIGVVDAKKAGLARWFSTHWVRPTSAPA